MAIPGCDCNANCAYLLPHATCTPAAWYPPLNAICAALLAAEINIHYAYPFLLTKQGPSLAIYCDDSTLAAQLLIRKGFTLIGESDLRK